MDNRIKVIYAFGDINKRAKEAAENLQNIRMRSIVTPEERAAIDREIKTLRDIEARTTTAHAIDYANTTK